MPLILKNIISPPLFCASCRVILLSLQKIGCTRHKCSSKLGIFCTHLHYLYILEWYTPSRWGATPAAPPVPHRFFLFWGWAAVYALFPTLVKQRESTPSPPLSTGWTMPPPPSGLFLHAGGSPVSMTVSYSVSACGADSWPCGQA